MGILLETKSHRFIVFALALIFGLQVPFSSKAQETILLGSQSFQDEEYGVYRFAIPGRYFSRRADHEYRSNDLNASITFRFETEYIGDINPNVNLYVSFRQAKQGLRVTYQLMKKNYFVVSGFDKNGRIRYIRGDSESLFSKSGCEDCEPSWKWTKLAVVTFQYPVTSKQTMNPILSGFLKSYELNLGLL